MYQIISNNKSNCKTSYEFEWRLTIKEYNYYINDADTIEIIYNKITVYHRDKCINLIKDDKDLLFYYEK